ncbi:TetR/AcrR family transcriptional regulator [Nocardia sp. NPDC050406]|uniref:TetR/AcrR family transcriptional regulator n=1 Tax=Nocardia sp. NPDC050406 TaxID=3364318 RepID=UPI00379D5D40
MSDWLGGERAALAAERIVDAAARLFAERGVAATQMVDIAWEAGCSRATLYRYFDSLHAVRLAFVHREARRVGAAVAAETSAISDPGERLVELIAAALRMVRADPLLIAWFRPADAGFALEIGQSSQVIEAMVASYMPLDDEDRITLARWTTRVIVSLLTVPGRDEAEERALLQRFVAPVLTRKADRAHPQ